MNTIHSMTITTSAFEFQQILAFRSPLSASLLAPGQASALSKCPGGQVFRRHSVFHQRHGGLRARNAVLAIQPYPRIYPPRGGHQP